MDEFGEEDVVSLSQSQRANALSTKISSVVSTFYTDTEIREAFASLDERQVKNTPEARRRLRSDIQKSVIDANGSIVRDFERVAQQLRQVGSLISSLNQCMNDIRTHTDVASKDVLPVLQEAEILLNQQREVDTQQNLLDAFNKHFNISDDDLAILTSSTLPVDDQFFLRLTKLRRVHVDCQVLLGTEDQQLGVELMDQTTRTLDGAYEKLSRWIQKEFKTLDLENPRIHAPIRRALKVLAQRPSLFQECLNFFAEVRERNLTDAFYGALTGSSSQTDDRTTKPMEFYAHDAPRFVGDILAWLHSTAVSERESLEVLFVAGGGEEIARDVEPWLQDDGQAFDGRKTLETLINRDLAGVSKALRQRIEQVIRSDDNPVLAYKIANLIGFYKVTLVRLLGTESSVLANLTTLRNTALQQYRSSTKDYADSNSIDASYVPIDLAPPEFLFDALKRLEEIIMAYGSSYALPEDRDEDLTTIYQEAVSPFQQSCSQLAAKLDEPSSSIFSVNFLSLIRTALNFHGFPGQTVSDIEDQIDDHSAKMIEYQHSFFRQTSGLETILIALAPLADSEEDLLSIFKLDAFQKQALIDSSQILDDFLHSALMDGGENLKRLRDRSMAEEITTEAAARFCEDFDQVEEKLSAADVLLEQHGGDVLDQAGNPPAPLRSIFQRTSGDIRVLLS